MNTDSTKNITDRLNRKPFAQQIAYGLVNSIKNGSESLVLSINGSWGNGKSVLLDYLEEEIKKEIKIYNEKVSKASTEENKIVKQKAIIIKFNPWLFSGQEQLQRVFFKELKKKLKSLTETVKEKISDGVDFLEKEKKRIEEIGGEQANKALEEIEKKIDDAVNNEIKDDLQDSKLLKFFDQLDESIFPHFENIRWASSIFSLLKSVFKKEDSEKMPLEKIKEKISKKLAEKGIKLYIFIDDIDRLTPVEIAQIFQLVKLNVSFQNMIFILAYEKEVVEGALYSQYKEGSKRYLEKIVQVDYSLPEIPAFKIQEILKEELKKVFDDLKIPFSEEYIAWVNKHSSMFLNIRHINRYTNAIRLRLGYKKDDNSKDEKENLFYQEIHITDFLMIEVLRIYDYATYQLLYQEKGKFFRESKKEYFENWLKEQKLSENIESMLGSLSYQFTDIFNTKFNKRLFSEAHFDRYFTLQLHPNDISEKNIEDFLQNYQDVNKQVAIVLAFLENTNDKSSKFENFCERLSLLLRQNNYKDEHKKNFITFCLAFGEMREKNTSIKSRFDLFPTTIQESILKLTYHYQSLFEHFLSLVLENKDKGMPYTYFLKTLKMHLNKSTEKHTLSDLYSNYDEVIKAKSELINS